MTLSKKMDYAINEFKGFRSIKPTKLFIGKKEQVELELLAMDFGWVTKNYLNENKSIFDNEEKNRIEFRGMKVYRVDDLTYCEVAK